MQGLSPGEDRPEEWSAAAEAPIRGVRGGAENGVRTGDGEFRFTYFSSAGTMFLNDVPLIKGVPAALLLRMLRARVEQGQRLFFLSEFRGEKESGQLSNLEARLGRLEKRLEERGAGLRLVRLRGCRRIECEGPIELKII